MAMQGMQQPRSPMFIISRSNTIAPPIPTSGFNSPSRVVDIIINKGQYCTSSVSLRHTGKHPQISSLSSLVFQVQYENPEANVPVGIRHHHAPPPNMYIGYSTICVRSRHFK
jgi:hypothetical protein